MTTGAGGAAAGTNGRDPANDPTEPGITTATGTGSVARTAMAAATGTELKVAIAIVTARGKGTGIGSATVTTETIATAVESAEKMAKMVMRAVTLQNEPRGSGQTKVLRDPLSPLHLPLLVCLHLRHH